MVESVVESAPSEQVTAQETAPVSFQAALTAVRELHRDLAAAQLNTAPLSKWAELQPRVEGVRQLVNISWRAQEDAPIEFVHLHQHMVQLASAVRHSNRATVETKLRLGIRLQ